MQKVYGVFLSTETHRGGATQSVEPPGGCTISVAGQLVTLSRDACVGDILRAINVDDEQFCLWHARSARYLQLDKTLAGVPVGIFGGGKDPPAEQRTGRERTLSRRARDAADDVVDENDEDRSTRSQK